MSGSDTDAERADATPRTSDPGSLAGLDSPDRSDPSRTDETDGQLGGELPFERPPIEPEDPAVENAFFVVLGVLGTVGLLATVVVPGAL
ncbi:MAG: hypothetical protein ABEI27_11660 [Halobellus sp.]|uniref:DUF7312 domain-containing protein n=1 Tax=Halobellus sp. TaxID=1979212 RepID=UPI0035D42331